MKTKLLKVLYYFLSWTWGLPMTLIGAITTLVLVMIGEKQERHCGALYTKTGKGWGGLELGWFFLCSEGAGLSTKNHEFGHSLQNCIWGPLMPFVVCIPSAARYWLRKLKTNKTKLLYSSAFYCLGVIILAATTLLLLPTWLLLALCALGGYLMLMGMWLAVIETPKYLVGPVEYNAVWFEHQASYWGNHHYFYWKDSKKTTK